MLLHQGFSAVDQVGRVRRSQGVVLALLGPDGVGKTTAAGLVEKELAPHFSSTIRYHLRPFFGRRFTRGIPPNGPYALPPRAPVLSIAKVLLWLADFAVSYLVCILPRLRRDGLVVFDRAFEDILVDPLRYRYGGPLWFPRIASGFVPTVGRVVVFLDAPVETIQARKGEVSPAETARQRAEYLQLARRLKNSHVVDAARPVADVVAEVVRIVMETTGRKLAGRSPAEIEAR